MHIPIDSRRPLVPTAALTVYDVIVVATWALLFWLLARRSKSSLIHDLFGVILAVAALTGG
jgi:hypothetical protein